jgi:intracellular septation protein
MTETSMTEAATTTTAMTAAATNETATNETRKLNPTLKLALDIGPLVLFFATYGRFGIFSATAILMVAVAAALAVSYWLIRRWPIMPVVTAIVVMIFGGLTLVLHDETFIKLKPTIIYSLFGAVLAGGYLFDRPFLAIVFDSVFHITEEGWRKLTLRWAAFFFALAALNEVIWRTQSTDFWVSFKLFGFTALTFVFAALQYPLLMRHAVAEPHADAPDEAAAANIKAAAAGEK